MLLAPSLIPVEEPKLPARDAVLVPTPFALKVAIFGVIVVPFLAMIAAPFLAWGGWCGPVDIALFFGFYLLSGFGITIGFHRLFVHRSFETTGWMKVLFGIAGSMAWEGTLLHWSAMHRRHHQLSDTPGDPHSPVGHGEGFVGMLKGLFHSHMGWFFRDEPADLDRYVKDLKQNRSLSFISKTFFFWAILGLALPAIIGGLVTQSWMGALTGFIWGGLVRVCFVHHVTWSVNSACHLWGRRPYVSSDESTNNTVFGILALGEGWHNAHHAFPTSARHGLRWWEFDASWIIIRALSLVGLAWNVKVPTEEQLKKADRYAVKA